MKKLGIMPRYNPEGAPLLVSVDQDGHGLDISGWAGGICCLRSTPSASTVEEVGLPWDHRTAMGLPGEPIAPFIGTGTKM